MFAVSLFVYRICVYIWDIMALAGTLSWESTDFFLLYNILSYHGLTSLQSLQI